MKHIEAIFTNGIEKTYRANDAENVWGIFNFFDELSNRTFRAKGVIQKNLLVENLEFILYGKWEQNKYGWTFSLSNYTIKTPAGEYGTIAFLKSLPHIGSITANKIWRQYKNEVFENFNEILDNCVKDRWISAKHKQNILEAKDNNFQNAKFKSPLISLLGNIGFPKNLPQQILEERLGNPVEEISKNPFRLLKFPGVGFLKTDELRQRLDLPSDLPSRQEAAATYLFEQQPSTIWIQINKLCFDLRKLLDCNFETSKKIIERLIGNNDFAFYMGFLAVRQHAKNEFECCRKIIEKTKVKNNWPKINQSGNLSNHQIETLQLAESNGSIAFLLGSAGTGKTYTAADVIKSYRNLGKSVAICAPSGKAALRIEQTIREFGIQDIHASTIHRLLAATIDRNGWHFGIDGINNFIEADLVLVDEGSMIDNFLMLSILKATKPETNILVIGDPNQLAPVSKGSMLRDWVRWCDLQPDFKFGLLKEIHRNSGAIVKTCFNIINNNPISIPSYKKVKYDWTKDNNLYLIESDLDETSQKVLSFFDGVLDKKLVIKEGEIARVANPLTDIQVIVATNENSPVSRKEMNIVLQNKLNPEKKGEHKTFKVNDKIICIKNTRVADPANENEQLFLANGSLGVVVESHYKFIRAKMDDYPNQILTLPTGLNEGDFSLAYAITCHKMQGSQTKCTLILLGQNNPTFNIVDRGWLYTAITRSQNLSIIFGTRQDITRARNKINVDSRRSFALDWFKKCHH